MNDMLLTEDQIRAFEYLFEGVRYVDGSHMEEYQTREDRTLESFELQFYLKEKKTWSAPIWFHIWINNEKKDISINYGDNRDYYGFATLNEIDHEGIKIFDWLFRYVEDHPKTRLLLLMEEWKLGSAPIMERALTAFRNQQGERFVYKHLDCDYCQSQAPYLENEFAKIILHKEELAFILVPKRHHSDYFALESNEVEGIHRLVKHLQHVLKKQEEEIDTLTWHVKKEHVHASIETKSINQKA